MRTTQGKDGIVGGGQPTRRGPLTRLHGGVSNCRKHGGRSQVAATTIVALTLLCTGALTIGLVTARGGRATAGPAASARPVPSSSSVLTIGSSSATPEFPRPANASDPKYPECPYPVSICPCILSDASDRLAATLLIDASTSVFTADFESARSGARTGLTDAMAEYRAKHKVQAEDVLCQTFWADPQPDAATPGNSMLGDCPEPLGSSSHAFTRFNKVFDLIRSATRDTLFILVTDGIQSLAPGRCAADATKLNSDFADALSNGYATVVINQVSSKEGPNCARLKCPSPDRCKLVEWSGAAVTPSLVSAIKSAAESRRRVHPAQQTPEEDTSSVLMLGDANGMRCTGIAVSSRAVLTARHCDVDRAQIQGGVDGGLEVAVVQRKDHPNLDARMLELAHPLRSPILPRRGSKDNDPPQGALRFVGFGSKHSGAPAFRERKDMPLTAAGWGCDGRRASFVGCAEGQELVLPGSGGADTCNGDSGGPVFELAPGLPCNWRLVGITSRRVGDAREACGNGGIYVRADVIASWIDETLVEWEAK